MALPSVPRVLSLPLQGWPQPQALRRIWSRLAFHAEPLQAGPDAAENMSRLALTLDDTSLNELCSRLWEVVEEFADRAPDTGGLHYSLMVALHRQPARDVVGDD
ncbi:MAG: hypothetical protein M3N51_11010 [Actinomycetota bacterium]|nr:hypothetical protein [Actinomycetota bacterium]